MFFNEIKFGDKDPVQHVCFVVHGIGEACDTKFRPLIECVEDFRETSRTILQSHFKTYVENDQIHRVVSVRSSDERLPEQETLERENKLIWMNNFSVPTAS